MGKCPFCKAEVSGELLRLGGRCPKCLIEIPGEEAPTDPGEAAKAQIAQAEAAARRSPVPYIVAAVLVLIAGGAAAWTVFGGEPPVPELVQVDTSKFKAVRHINLDDGEEAQIAETQVRTPGKASEPSSQKVSRPVVDPDAPVASPDAVADVGTPSTEDPEVQRINEVGSGPATAGILGGSSPRAGAIKGLEGCGESLAPTVKSAGPHVERGVDKCFAEARGRINKPDLGAKVSLDFTYQKDGTFGGVIVEVRGNTDKAFQDCVTATMQKSRFTPICEEIGVSKTISVGSGG
jgi:hypothetical protein